MGNEGGGTGDTQESASAGPDCLEDYNSQHASQATPSFLVPVLDERVGGRGRSNMKLEFFDWRKLGLLSAFFGCDWQGAPRALIFFFLELGRSKRRRSLGEHCSCPPGSRPGTPLSP